MTRTERDLRAALHELEQHADRAGGPSAASLVATATGNDHATGSDGHHGRRTIGRRTGPSRWLAPLTAAAAVAAAAVIVAVTVHSGRDDGAPVGDRPTASGSAPASSTAPSPVRTDAASRATAVLDAAATLLDTQPFTAPGPQQYYYVRTNDASTWTSVSGRREGLETTSDGADVPVPGCRHGQRVAHGEDGPCTLNDVPHYRGDAPTTAPAWDAYLEDIAPGAKAAHAQGKIIVQVLHGDLISPQATAALLRYTAMCAGLHTFAVKPVDGRALTGVTCTSMTNGSYGLVFDSRTQAYVGFVGVGTSGQQDTAPEIIRTTGVVAKPGRRP